MSSSKTKTKRPGSQGEFCIVDRRVLEFIMENGKLQTALPAFIALATCADGTNTTTRGGVNCCCNYLGLSRRSASMAIDSLVQMGVLERLELAEIRDPTQSRFRIRSVAEIRGEPKPANTPGVEVPVFLPNSAVRTDEGRSSFARLLTNGLTGSIPTLVSLYAELDFESFSGIRPQILSSSIPRTERIKVGRYLITRLDKPAILDGKMPRTDHLGDSFRDLKCNPDIVENLRLEGLLQWVVWIGQSSQPSEFTGFPLVAFGATGADLGAPETAVGLSHHLLSELIAGNGRDFRDLADLQSSFVNASTLDHVGLGFSTELKAIACAKLQQPPRSVRGLAWEYTMSKQCRDLMRDVAQIVEQEFAWASGLARQLLQAYERKG